MDKETIREVRDDGSLALMFGALFVAGCTCILIALVVL